MAVADIDVAQGEAVTASLVPLGAAGALFVATDVADGAAVQAMVDAAVARFGGLDILVNNAQWVAPKVPLLEKTDEMLARTLDTGLWATFRAMQAAVPVMRRRGGGRIVNLCSLIGLSGTPLYGDYAATKEAIRGLTRVAANEWAADGILVNALAPVARTPAVDRYAADHPDAVAAAEQANPLGRLGDPEARHRRRRPLPRLRRRPLRHRHHPLRRRRRPPPPRALGGPGLRGIAPIPHPGLAGTLRVRTGLDPPDRTRRRCRDMQRAGEDIVTTLALGEEDDSPLDHDVITTQALGEEDDSPDADDRVTTMALGEEDDSPVDDEVTTLALGEEDDTPIDDTVTTTALGEEDDRPIDHEVTTALGEEDDTPIDDPSRPCPSAKEDDSPIDHEVTTTALGEEDDTPIDDRVTTDALGEEDDSPDSPIDDGDTPIVDDHGWATTTVEDLTGQNPANDWATTTVDDLVDPAEQAPADTPNDWATTTVDDLVDTPNDYATTTVDDLVDTVEPMPADTPNDYATTTIDDLVDPVETPQDDVTSTNGRASTYDHARTPTPTERWTTPTSPPSRNRPTTTGATWRCEPERRDLGPGDRSARSGGRPAGSGPGSERDDDRHGAALVRPVALAGRPAARPRGQAPSASMRSTSARWPPPVPRHDHARGDRSGAGPLDRAGRAPPPDPDPRPGGARRPRGGGHVRGQLRRQHVVPPQQAGGRPAPAGGGDRQRRGAW